MQIHAYNCTINININSYALVLKLSIQQIFNSNVLNHTIEYRFRFIGTQ